MVVVHPTCSGMKARDHDSAQDSAKPAPRGGVELEPPPYGIALVDAGRSVIHAKLQVGPPEDPFEREADWIAEQIFSMSEVGAPLRSSAREQVQRSGGGLEAGASSLGGREAPAIVHEVLRSPGQSLDPTIRAFIEPRLGHDFSEVRVHVDDRAAASARAIDALAYTVGQHVVFGADQYAPSTGAGARLIAHELVHTLQQGSGSTLRRKPAASKPSKERIVIKIPKDITTLQQFLRFAEVQIFGRVINHAWDTSGAPSVIHEPAKHVGTSINFWIMPWMFEVYGRADSGAAGRAESDHAYERLAADEKGSIDAEIDRRYYASTKEAPGSKIKPGEPSKAAIWHSLQREVLADKRKLEQLPQAVRAMLGPSNFTPEHYELYVQLGSLLSQLSEAELAGFFAIGPKGATFSAAEHDQLLSIARKLAKLGPEARKDYLARVNATTTSLTDLERAIDRYIDLQTERATQKQSHETAAKPLLGAEDLYTKYRAYEQWQRNEALASALKGVARDKSSAEDSHAYLQDKLKEAETALLAALAHKGFASIAAFEAAIESYRVAFRTQAVNVALDVLARYEHMLFEERNKLAAGGAATIAQGIAASKASEHYKEYREQEQIASNILSAKEPKETWWVAPYNSAKTAATDAKRQGEAAVIRGSGNNPLISERGVELETFADLDAAGVQANLTELITQRSAAAQTARREFEEDPDRVFKLPDLVAATQSVLGVDSTTIYGRIIRDHMSDEASTHLLSQVALGILALALTFLVPGGGWVAAAALVGQAGISTYQAYAAYKEYAEQQRDWELGFLAEKPSLFWVGVAVAGAALDLGVATTTLLKQSSAALKALEGPLLEFAQDGNAAKLLARIEAAEGLNAKVKLAMARELESAQAAKAAWKDLLGYGGRLGGFAGFVDPGLVKAMFRAIYYSVKRGVDSIAKLSADAKFLDIAGDLTRMSGAERAQIEAALEEVKQIVNVGKTKGMDDAALRGFVDRWALNRHKPGFQIKLGEEMQAWKPLTDEQRRVLNALEEQRTAVKNLYEQKAAAQEELAALRAQPDKSAEDLAEIRSLEKELRGLDPSSIPGKPVAGKGKIAEAEATLAMRETDAARAELSLYDRLRAAVPSDAAKQHKLAGVRTDQVGPLRIKPSGELQVDHIVSVREIADMDGFARLPWKDQKAIVDMRENLIVMDASANASKGDRTWRSWLQAGNYYERSTIEAMAKQEAQVRALIEKAIQERLALLPAGKP